MAPPRTSLCGPRKPPPGSGCAAAGPWKPARPSGKCGWTSTATACRTATSPASTGRTSGPTMARWPPPTRTGNSPSATCVPDVTPSGWTSPRCRRRTDFRATPPPTSWSWTRTVGPVPASPSACSRSPAPPHRCSCRSPGASRRAPSGRSSRRPARDWLKDPRRSHASHPTAPPRSWPSRTGSCRCVWLSWGRSAPTAEWKSPAIRTCGQSGPVRSLKTRPPPGARADSLAARLRALGLAPDQLFTVGRGAREPLASGTDPFSLQLNRRSDVQLVCGGAAAEPELRQVEYQIVIENDYDVELKGLAVHFDPPADSARIELGDSLLARVQDHRSALPAIPPRSQVVVRGWLRSSADSVMAVLEGGNRQAGRLLAQGHNPLLPAQGVSRATVATAALPDPRAVPAGATVEVTIEPASLGWPDLTYALP